MWAVAVELGEESLSRFFSLTSPFLDESQRPLTAIDHFLRLLDIAELSVACWDDHRL